MRTSQAILGAPFAGVLRVLGEISHRRLFPTTPSRLSCRDALGRSQKGERDGARSAGDGRMAWGAFPCHRHHSRVRMGRAVVHSIGYCLFLGAPEWVSVGQARLTAQTQPEDMSDVSTELFAGRLAGCPPSFSPLALPLPPHPAPPVPAIILVLCLPHQC